MENRQYIKPLLSVLFQTIQGWSQWHQICKKYRQNNYLVVCIPNVEVDYSKWAFEYLDDLVLARGYEKAIVITKQSGSIAKYKKYSTRILDILYYNEEEINNFRKFYALCNFDSRFVLATFEVPYGKCIDKISNIPGFSYEEAFAYGVYRLKPYSKIVSKALQKRMIEDDGQDKK